MKRITAIALFVAVTLLAAGHLIAEPTSGKVNVPFNFTVNNISLPAGTYTIGSDLMDPNMLVIRDQSNQVKAIGLGMSAVVTPGKPGSLTFHHYGDQYFLSEIHFGSVSQGIYLPATKLEKHIKKLSRRESVSTVGIS
jgi:hypothetical protein